MRSISFPPGVSIVIRLIAVFVVAVFLVPSFARAAEPSVPNWMTLLVGWIYCLVFALDVLPVRNAKK